MATSYVCDWCGRWCAGDTVTYMTLSGELMTKVGCKECSRYMHELDQRNRAFRDQRGVYPVP